jgi:hypothetical protein
VPKSRHCRRYLLENIPPPFLTYFCGGQFAEEEEVLFPPCTLLEVLCKKPQEILDEQEETFKKFDTNG